MKERARAAGKVTRDILTDAPLPKATKTYTVISHKFVIDTIKKLLDQKGFVVTDEIYAATDSAQIAYGIFHINHGNDPDLGMLFAFNNSYNKQLRFSCAVGAYVKSNKTSMLTKDAAGWVRMHTGTADKEAADTIEEQIDNAAAYFDQLKKDKEAMLGISITRREYGELLGRLFVDAKIMGVEQISLAKKEYEKPSFAYTSEPESLWTIYNHILVALAKSHPRTWMEQQKLVHYHMMTEFDFTVFDEEPTVDPNQLSLLDSIENSEVVALEEVADLPVEIPTQEQIDNDDVAVNEAEILTNEQIEEADPEPDTPVIPAIRFLTKKEIVEEYGDVLPENQLKTLGIQIKPELEEEKPKTTITMKDAIVKYGHLVSEEDRASLLKAKGPDSALTVIRAAYQADQEKPAVEELPDILPKEESTLKDKGGKPTTTFTEEIPQVSSEPIDESFESFDEAANVSPEVFEEVKPEVLPTKPKSIKINNVGPGGYGIMKDIPNTLDEKVPTILGADSAEEEAEVRKVLAESGMALPQAPSKVQEVIETPAGEVVAEDVSEEVVIDFFMTPDDISGVLGDQELIIGLVLTIGDDECEVVSISEEEIGFGVVTSEEVIEEVVEEVIEAPEAEPVDMNFNIGEATQMAPPETMLRKQSNSVENFGEVTEEVLAEEDAASIEKSMEIMNSKVELSPEEEATKKAISVEVLDLYGSVLNFTYKLSGEQYTIQLETGESFILASAYVETIKSTL